MDMCLPLTLFAPFLLADHSPYVMYMLSINDIHLHIAVAMFVFVTHAPPLLITLACRAGPLNPPLQWVCVVNGLQDVYWKSRHCSSTTAVVTGTSRRRDASKGHTGVRCD